MRDYIVNTKGKRRVIEGNDNYSRSDFEYWKFVYIENTWLLSNILQKNEVGSGYKKLYREAVIEGNDNYSRSDFEYWKFVYIENTWLLSNILQKNEVGSGYKKLYREAENAYGSSNMKKV